MAAARLFLRDVGRRTWPDGSTGARYAFVHTAYQRVIRELLPSGRRALLHRRIAARLETGYAGRTREIAADLADHFQRGHDVGRAVKYLWVSAAHAIERGAFRDAAACMESALGHFDSRLDSREQMQQELTLRQAYGSALSHIPGRAAARQDNLARTLELARRLDDLRAHFDALYALTALQATCGDCTAATRASEELLALARRAAVPASWRAPYIAGVVGGWAFVGVIQNDLGFVVFAGVFSFMAWNAAVFFVLSKR